MNIEVRLNVVAGRFKQMHEDAIITQKDEFVIELTSRIHENP